MNAIKVLKWIMFALFVFSLAMSIVYSMPRKARAENVSPEIATLQLFIGETAKVEMVIPDKIGKTTHPFVFPLFKERTDYVDTAVSYRNGKWSAVPGASRFTERNDDLLNSVMFLLLGIIAIAIFWLVRWVKSLMREMAQEGPSF